MSMARVNIMKRLILPRLIKSVIFSSKSQEGPRIAITFLAKMFMYEYFTALKINELDMFISKLINLNQSCVKKQVAE